MSSSLWESVSRLVRSPAFKFFLIGGLALLLGIPLLMVWALSSERENRSQSVAGEIARLWGQPQHLNGPFLIVPYTVKVTKVSGDKRIEEVVTRLAVFLPDQVDVEGRVTTKILRRSIYDVTVYTADLTLKGRFARPDMRSLSADIVATKWDEAWLALGIADVAGIKSAGSVSLSSGDTLALDPSTGSELLAANGVHVRLRDARVLDPAVGATAGPATGIAPFDVTIPLSLAGSSSLMVAPAGRTTTVRLVSEWPHPSFTGAFLPTDRKVDAAGFSATWSVPHLARSIPQVFSIGGPDVGFGSLVAFAFGVAFQEPVTFYSLVERSLKYGLMFIGAAFMSVFLMELLAGRRVHPVQYLFTGIALVFFFVLLLSLAEHIGFAAAYALASFATAGQIALYVGRVLASRRRGLVILGLLLFLFGLLYLILQLEDYALLAGALTGFAMLTTIMFLTLRVDWSGGGLKPAEKGS